MEMNRIKDNFDLIDIWRIKNTEKINTADVWGCNGKLPIVAHRYCLSFGLKSSLKGND